MADLGMSDIRIHEIRTLGELEQLRAPWGELLEAMPSATPFQTWEWVYGLAQGAGHDGRLRIVVAERRGGTIVGIAPLWLRSLGLPRVAALEFIGDGVSDYLDVLVLEPYGEAVVARLLGWTQRSGDWRVLRLRALRRASVELLARHARFDVLPYDVAPYADLPASLEEYEGRVLRKKLRQDIHRQHRRLVEAGRLAFHVDDAPDAVGIRLDDFFELHQRRQRSKGERGRFYDRKRRDAFRERSRVLAQAGILRLGLATIDAVPAACFYNLRMGERECFYLASMNPAYAEYGPGNLLQRHMIGEAIGAGMKVYDFGCGDEPYKARWTTGSVDLFQLVRARTGVDALVLRNLDAWRTTVQRSPLVKRIYLETVGRLQRAV